MADKQPLMTHDQDLGPGVVRTPGYPADDTLAINGISDRRVNHLGEPADHPILSTYDGPQNGLTSAPPKPRFVVTEVPGSPDSTVATPAPEKGAKS